MKNYDITELIDLKTDPDMVFQLLTSVIRIVRLINAKQDYGRRLDKVLKIVLDYLDVEQGSIMVLEKRKWLVVRAATRHEIIGMKQSIEDNCIASWVVKSGEPVFIPDISKDDRFEKREGDAYKTLSLLSVPILHKNRIAGVFNMTDKSGSKDLLKEDIAYLLEFSSLILSLLLQQNMNHELKNQKNILKKRNKELRRQEMLRTELTRMLVHDLKAPLSEVVANLDILSYSISDENREFLESGQIGCDRAVRMVSNLVDVDRIGDGKMILLKEDVNPRLLLEESISSVKGLAKIRDVELILDLPLEEELPDIRLDRTLILRVLQNLVTNGFGHSSTGTTIIVGCRKTPGKKRLEFFVKDQGPGIPAFEQERIFDKYARISSKQDSLVGTGLGLHFCRLAVEVHNGKIGVESAAAAGEGSRFYFSLPL